MAPRAIANDPETLNDGSTRLVTFGATILGSARSDSGGSEYQHLQLIHLSSMSRTTLPTARSDDLHAMEFPNLGGSCLY